MATRPQTYPEKPWFKVIMVGYLWAGGMPSRCGMSCNTPGAMVSLAGVLKLT